MSKFRDMSGTGFLGDVSRSSEVGGGPAMLTIVDLIYLTVSNRRLGRLQF